MDENVVEGEVFEPERNSRNKFSARRREGERAIRIPMSGEDISSRPADLDGEGFASAVPNAPGDRDFSPLLEARAEEFYRRYDAMTRAYEEATFGAMADALGRIGAPEERSSIKKPFAQRLVSSCGEALIQAGQRLISAAESGQAVPALNEPSWPVDVDAPTVIVLMNEGAPDDKPNK